MNTFKYDRWIFRCQAATNKVAIRAATVSVHKIRLFVFFFPCIHPLSLSGFVGVLRVGKNKNMIQLVKCTGELEGLGLRLVCCGVRGNAKHSDTISEVR